jgi:hypothetical protein
VRRLLPLVALCLLPACYQSYPRIALDEDAGDACMEEPFEADRVYPGVFILLDYSRSMWYPTCDDPDVAWDYWTPATEGVRTIVGSLGQSVAFGLSLFPDPAGGAESPNCYIMDPVPNPVRLDNADAIAATLAGATCPDGGTPTALALESSIDALRPYIELRTASVLLVTDGAPNCNLDLDHLTCTCTSPEGSCDYAHQCLDDVRTHAILDRMLGTHGIETHVLGLVGATGHVWTEEMHEMAVHGGTEEAVLVSDPDDVAPVMEEIARQIVPCLFDVDPDDVAEPDAVLFEVDGTRWPRDGARLSGWDLVEPDRVRFFGPPCTEILDGRIDTIVGVVPCVD